jgi:hypothetical protein
LNSGCEHKLGVRRFPAYADLLASAPDNAPIATSKRGPKLQQRESQ